MMCASDVILLLFFFFFKQKTAYEMRISDWSSDVCSSDLLPVEGMGGGAMVMQLFMPRHRLLPVGPVIARHPPQHVGRPAFRRRHRLQEPVAPTGQRLGMDAMIGERHRCFEAVPQRRSEERRVGKECDRPCRSRWAPDH